MRRLRPMSTHALRSVLLLALGLALGWFWRVSSGQATPARDDLMEQYGRFVDAIEQVANNYVKPISREQLVDSALRGMLAELDPYSVFYNDADWKQFQRQIDGSFTGIGVQLDFDRRTGRLIVVAPLVGSPAYRAGVLAGDQILEVDGQSTENWTRGRAVDAMTGPPGTEVKLTLKHPGATESETLTITREIIEIDSVLGDHRKPDDTWDFMLDPERKIGYVRVTTFAEDTATDLRAALEELKDQGVQGLILDLRDNPGGRLEAAVEVSDLFLADGAIVSVRGRNAPERPYSAVKNDAFEDIPMVVLVNQHSASASEIVAAALQDHKRAQVVGVRSWGKGTVQGIVPLDEGASRLRLTVATYWRPSGRNIHRFKDARPGDEWGVSPDEGLEVRMTDEQYLARVLERQRRDTLSKANKPAPDAKPDDPFENDPQLAKALDVLKAALDKPNTP